MRTGPHVAVIGAGVLGVCTAAELIERGARVTLLEARSIAAGSSGRSCGMVGTQFTDPFDLALRRHAMRRFRAWRTELGLRFNPVGYLRLARTTAQMELFARTLPDRTGSGFASRLCGPEEIRALAPHLDTSDFAGGSFGPEDGFIDPHQMCTLLVNRLREQGAAFRQGCPVEGVDRRGAGWCLTTGRGEVDCDVVVNAAGAWAPQVAALFGQTLHVRGERHEALEIELDRPLDYVMPMVMDLLNGEGTGLNFRHDGPGHMLTEIHKVETTAPEDPDRYNDQCEEATKADLAEALIARLPGLDGARLGRGWAGLYPVTADHRPLVGPIDNAEPGVITAAGAGGYGIQLSPVIGLAAADWAVHGGTPSAPELEALRPTAARNLASLGAAGA